MPLNVNKIRDLISTLENKYEFTTDLTLAAYNPMEEFVTYVTPKEIVHSKIIAELLNPKGRHSMGDTFLKEFVNNVGWHINENSDVNIKTEYSVNGMHKNNRRIDILVKIHNQEDRVIIIENKLNGAEYQPYQLDDYYHAIKQEGYDDQNIVIVCLHLKEEKQSNSQIYYLTAGELAYILKEAIDKAPNSDSYPYILAYNRFLENLNVYNRTMNHARLLADITKISDDQFKTCQALYDAFKLLPNVFAEQLLFELKQNSAINFEEAEQEENYPEYIAIWTKNMWNNREEDCWLSIGFSFHEVRFYLVGYTELPYAEKCGFAHETTLKKRTWYHPQNEEDRVLKFENRPNYDEVLKRIDYFINMIERLRN